MGQKNKVRIRNFMILLSLGLAVAIFGHGCGALSGKSSKKSNNTLGAQCQGAVEIKAARGEIAESIVYGHQVLDNMVACTGLTSASEKTVAEFQARLASFSEYGLVSDVTAPMMMGVAAVAIEVCDDLVEQEDVNERIFVNFGDFDRNDVSLSNVEDALRRMARSCWGRNETSEERDTVSNSISYMKARGLSNREAAITVCTGVLASLDGIRM